MDGSAADEVLTVTVASRDEAGRRVLAAFRGERQDARISFASVDLLWRVLSPKRLDVIATMTGAGPLSIREVARRSGRDVKAVHGDVRALLDAGILERADAGVVFPYAGIHVDFTVRTAA
jgi:predicted transcriptional regulator